MPKLVRSRDMRVPHLPVQDSWSPEEDAKLRQLHAQYGTSWSRISKCLKGRTSQQCRARWHQINNGRSRSGQPAGSSSGGSGKQQAVSQQRLQPLAFLIRSWPCHW
jgi:hypothetical protein